MATISRQLLSVLLLPGVIAGIIPLLLARFVDASLHGSAFFYFGLVLFLFMLCIIHFHKLGKGTLAPWDATTQLIVKGPYKIVRNPMITAVLLVLVAEAFLLKNWAILLWALLFFVVNHIYFITIEEKALEKKFGQPYLDYKKAVPRWFPKKLFYSGK